MAAVENPRDVEITDVQTTRIDSPGDFSWTYVRIYTDAGVAGTGEMVLGPTADAYVEYAQRILIGENPVDLDARISELYDYLAHVGSLSGIGVTAISGIDIALHDLAGKLLGVPAHQLLGGKHRESVRVYCDAHAGAHLSEDMGEDAIDDSSIYEPEAYADAAEAVVDEGFDGVKFDLDATDRHEGDRRNRHLSPRAVEYRANVVEAVTERVGDRADVAFDCHWRWTGDSVRRLAKAIEPYGVWWLEDGVPPDNDDVQIEVTRETDTTIAAGENVYRASGARRLLEPQGIDVFHPDPPKTGGLRETRRAADMAELYSIPLGLHNVSSPLGTMASAHLGAACSNFLALEYHARELEWWDDLVGESIIEDGRVEVPDEPGLGIELDREAVAERVAEDDELFDAA